jgi:hypothetical protein
MLSTLIASKMANAKADPRTSPKIRKWDYDPKTGKSSPVLDYRGWGYGDRSADPRGATLAPVPKAPGFKRPGLGPVPVPTGSALESAESFEPSPDGGSWETDAAKRLATIGADMGDIKGVNKDDWGSGYVAYGQKGNAKPVSSTTRFGTATFAPGTFMIGGADPRRREFLTERDVAQSARSQRELSNFLDINAPTGTRDNYGTTDPMQDSRIRAGRAEAAAKANALNPLPTVGVDDPMEVERAGGQAAYNAQKLAEARFAAATSPVGREALDQDTRARATVAAAPGAMSIDAGADARDAFLRLLFPKLQAQGATDQDIAEIAALAKVTPEEAKKMLAEAGVR